jgi:hypothetical protein
MPGQLLFELPAQNAAEKIKRKKQEPVTAFLLRPVLNLCNKISPWIGSGYLPGIFDHSMDKTGIRTLQNVSFLPIELPLKYTSCLCFRIRDREQ